MRVAEGVDVNDIRVGWGKENILQCLRMSVSDLFIFVIQSIYGGDQRLEKGVDLQM